MKRIVTAIAFALIMFFSALGGRTVSAQAYTCSARSMIVIERDSGRVLSEHNADESLPMASTTKIVTAITVIEKERDLDKVVEIPPCAVGVEGSSIYLEEGERLSLRQLLYGLMLRSGNDCAVALAVAVSGSVKNFAEEMNRTALRAGANSSHFVNPHGLHDNEHYTTARDLAKISAYAMQNEVFREIAGTRRVNIPWQGKSYDRELVNKNKILTTLDGGDGVKTGYTTAAGRCLVASATRNGMSVIAVVLNCRPMFEDCKALIDEAFENYTNVDVMQRFGERVLAQVVNGKETAVELSVAESAFYPLRKNEDSELRFVVSDVSKMSAPVKKGEENGKIQIYLANRLLFEEKLYTINKVAVLSVADRLSEIVSEWAT